MSKEAKAPPLPASPMPAFGNIYSDRGKPPPAPARPPALKPSPKDLRTMEAAIANVEAGLRDRLVTIADERMAAALGPIVKRLAALEEKKPAAKKKGK